MTTVHKYLPVDEQGVSKHERVVLDISQQEAALLSLLLGCTACDGPGDDLYDALVRVLDADVMERGRVHAMAHMGRPNIRHQDVRIYLGQFPGE